MSEWMNNLIGKKGMMIPGAAEPIASNIQMTGSHERFVVYDGFVKCVNVG